MSLNLQGTDPWIRRRRPEVADGPWGGRHDPEHFRLIGDGDRGLTRAGEDLPIPDTAQLIGKQAQYLLGEGPVQFMIIGEDEDLHPLAGGPILQTQGEVETRLVLGQRRLGGIPMDDQFLELSRLRPEGKEETEDPKPKQPAWSKVSPSGSKPTHLANGQGSSIGG